MTADLIQPHLPLKPEVLHILFALLGGARHGYAIIKEVEERTEGRATLRPGALYRHLHRMLQDGLVVESQRREAPEADDERRRYYDVTPLGKKVAGAEILRMQEIVKQGLAKRLVAGSEGV